MDKIKYIVLALIVVLIIGGGIWLAKEKSAGPAGEQSFEEPATADEGAVSAPTTEAAATGTPAKTTTAKPKTITPAPGAVTLPYAEALAKYGQNGYRFQFADNCQIKPSSLVVKKGVRYMLDNRDDVAHRISVGSASYSLKAYGYAVPTASVAGAYNVYCDGRTVGKIHIEP